MVGTWMLCGNGWSLSGRYHGWHMGALWERTEFVWTLSWLAHMDALWERTEFVGTLRQGRRFRQSKSSKYRKYQGFGGLHARAAAPPPEHTRGGAFSAAKSTKHRKYRCGRPVRGARLQHVGTLNKGTIYRSQTTEPYKQVDLFGHRIGDLQESCKGLLGSLTGLFEGMVVNFAYLGVLSRKLA